MGEMVFRRRRLPHQDVAGHPIFITACLKGSISAVGYSRIDAYRRELDAREKPAKYSPQEWEHHKQKLLFALVDQLLDGDSAVCHLKDPDQAMIVQNAFLHFAGARYKLLAFVVMPSHHHWLFMPDEVWANAAIARFREKSDKIRTPRELISHSIQSYTATMCNRARGSQGDYWQRETFDHWARDEAEMLRIITYIENNPVKAGLTKRPEWYPWSSAKLRNELGLNPGDAIEKAS